MSELIDIAKEFLEKVTFELDKHTSQEGIIKVEGSKVILLTPAHIQFAVYGRGPGKKPPLDPILSWVKREGIIFDGTDEKGTAFAIQASIAKNGTKKWVPNAPNALEESILENLEAFNKEVGNIMSVTIEDELRQTYGKMFPKKIEIKL